MIYRKCLFFIITICFYFACTGQTQGLQSSAFQKLVDAHNTAIKKFKENKITQIEECYDSTFLKDYEFDTDCQFDTLFKKNEIVKIIPMLNDYAYFLYLAFQDFMYSYLCNEQINGTIPEQKVASQAAEGSRERFLGNAEKILKCVIELDSNRTVAYLNLADVQLNLYKTKEAEQNYTKYAQLMKLQNKADRIPSYVLKPELRKLIDDCDGD